MGYAQVVYFLIQKLGTNFKSIWRCVDRLQSLQSATFVNNYAIETSHFYDQLKMTILSHLPNSPIVLNKILSVFTIINYLEHCLDLFIMMMPSR